MVRTSWKCPQFILIWFSKQVAFYPIEYDSSARVKWFEFSFVIKDFQHFRIEISIDKNIFLFVLIKTIDILGKSEKKPLLESSET